MLRASGHPAKMLKPIACAAVVAVPLIGLVACSNQSSDVGGEQTPETSGTATAAALKTALKTADGTTVADASVDFADGYATVTVQTVATGLLSPGFHGLRIHSVGKCESASENGGGADFASAGSPLQVSDHNTYPASGDLTDLQVRPDGAAKLVTTSADFTAEDLRNGQGTALVVEAGPSGGGATSAAGSQERIACGVLAAGTSETTSISTSTSTSTVTTTVVPSAPAGPATSTTTSPPATSSSPTSPSTSTVTITVPSTTVTTTQPPTTSAPPGGPAGG